MVDPIVRPNIKLIEGPQITDVELAGSSLVLKRPESTPISVDLAPFFADGIQDASSLIAQAIASSYQKYAIVNPDPGTEKNGDLMVAFGVAYMRLSNRWVQLYPPLLGQQQEYQPGYEQYLAPGTYSFTVPDGIQLVNVTLNGAGGGSSAGDNIPNRGLPGNRVVTTIRVTPGETLTISIGGGGIGGNWQSKGQPGVGMFSGGQGGYGMSSGNGGGGGAASVILRGSDILVVAAGGGGAGGAGKNTAASAASGAAAPTPTGGNGNNGNGDSGGGGGGGGGYPFGGVGGVGGSGDSGGQQGSTGQSFSLDPMTTTSAANGGVVSGVVPNPGGNGSCTISW